MTEPRAHRVAHSPEQAAANLRREAQAGRLDAQAVDDVLSAAGHQVTRRRAPATELSEREVEVLRRLARGASNKQIAGELVISEKTVEHHVTHIYSKIGVTSRAAAALHAVQHGLL